MKNAKRLLSGLLALALVFTLFPVAAFASNPEEPAAQEGPKDIEVETASDFVEEPVVSARRGRETKLTLEDLAGVYGDLQDGETFGGEGRFAWEEGKTYTPNSKNGHNGENARTVCLFHPKERAGHCGVDLVVKKSNDIEGVNGNVTYWQFVVYEDTDPCKFTVWMGQSSNSGGHGYYVDFEVTEDSAGSTIMIGHGNGNDDSNLNHIYVSEKSNTGGGTTDPENPKASIVIEKLVDAEEASEIDETFEITFIDLDGGKTETIDLGDTDNSDPFVVKAGGMYSIHENITAEQKENGYSFVNIELPKGFEEIDRKGNAVSFTVPQDLEEGSTVKATVNNKYVEPGEVIPPVEPAAKADIVIKKLVADDPEAGETFEIKFIDLADGKTETAQLGHGDQSDSFVVEAGGMYSIYENVTAEQRETGYSFDRIVLPEGFQVIDRKGSAVSFTVPEDLEQGSMIEVTVNNEYVEPGEVIPPVEPAKADIVIKKLVADAPEADETFEIRFINLADGQFETTQLGHGDQSEPLVVEAGGKYTIFEFITAEQKENGYSFVNISLPEGFEEIHRNGSLVSFTVPEDLQEGSTIEVTVNNEYKEEENGGGDGYTTTVKVAKKVSGIDASLFGEEDFFTINILNNGVIVKTVDVNADGEADITGLEPGTYTVAEATDMPQVDGYEFVGVAISPETFTVKADADLSENETISITVTNTYKEEDGGGVIPSPEPEPGPTPGGGGRERDPDPSVDIIDNVTPAATRSGDNLVNIPDAMPPLASAPDALFTIEDGEVPLASLPKTGGSSSKSGLSLLGALAALAGGLLLKSKKDEEEQA